jgi:thiamine kinase-like enzyme
MNTEPPAKRQRHSNSPQALALTRASRPTTTGTVLSVKTHLHHADYQKFIYEVQYIDPYTTTEHCIFVKCISKAVDGRYNMNSMDVDPFQAEKDTYGMIHSRTPTQFVVPHCDAGATLHEIGVGVLQCYVSSAANNGKRVRLTLCVAPLNSYHPTLALATEPQSMWCLVTESMSARYTPFAEWLTLHTDDQPLQLRGVKQVLQAIAHLSETLHILHNDMHTNNVLVSETFASSSTNTSPTRTDAICLLDFDIADDLNELTFANHLHEYLQEENSDDSDVSNEDIHMATQSLPVAVQYATAWDSLKFLFNCVEDIPHLYEDDELQTHYGDLLQCCVELQEIDSEMFNYAFQPQHQLSNWYTLRVRKGAVSTAPVLPAPVLPAPVLPAPVLPAPVLPAPVLPAPVLPAPQSYFPHQYCCIC